MKKVIVTGHNGFIGPHLVRLLKESGYYVKGIDTNYFDDTCKFSDYEKPDEELIKDVRYILMVLTWKEPTQFVIWRVCLMIQWEL